MKKRGSVFMVLELLLVAGLILFIARIALKNYLRPAMDPGTQKALSGQGIDTTDYRTVIDSTKGKVEDITRQRLDALEGIKE